MYVCEGWVEVESKVVGEGKYGQMKEEGFSDGDSYKDGWEDRWRRKDKDNFK